MRSKQRNLPLLRFGHDCQGYHRLRDEFDDPRLTPLATPSHDAEALVEVLSDPNIGAFELKSKARNKLIDQYRSMSIEEKIATIKNTGGEIMNDLWNETLYDERVLSQLLKERFLEEAATP